MANAIEAKDSYTQGHIERVANLAVAVGQRLGLSGTDLTALKYGGFLHDIGKIGIELSILNKPGPLDEDEWNKVKEHPLTGYRICQPMKSTLGKALTIVRSHHEKLDGSGYPDGLTGDDIPLVARIMAVVDIYDALVTERPYAQALPKSKALGILDEDVQSGRLDADIVEKFRTLISEGL